MLFLCKFLHVIKQKENETTDRKMHVRAYTKYVNLCHNMTNDDVRKWKNENWKNYHKKMKNLR